MYRPGERRFGGDHRGASEGLGGREGIFHLITFVQSHKGSGSSADLLNTSATFLH